MNGYEPPTFLRGYKHHDLRLGDKWWMCGKHGKTEAFFSFADVADKFYVFAERHVFSCAAEKLISFKERKTHVVSIFHRSCRFRIRTWIDFRSKRMVVYFHCIYSYSHHYCNDKMQMVISTVDSCCRNSFQETRKEILLQINCKINTF